MHPGSGIVGVSGELYFSATVRVALAISEIRYLFNLATRRPLYALAVCLTVSAPHPDFHRDT